VRFLHLRFIRRILEVPTEPLPPEMNPRLLFERMFGDLDVSANAAQRKNQNCTAKVFWI